MTLKEAREFLETKRHFINPDININDIEQVNYCEVMELVELFELLENECGIV